MSGTMFIIAIISTAAWASLFPHEILEFLNGLRYQLRQHVIRRTGEDAAQNLDRNLHAIANQRDIEPEIIEEVLIEHHGWIVERFGEKYADDILGDADDDQGDP